MRLTYTIAQYDARQRLMPSTPPTPSRSFVKAFLQLLYCSMSNVAENIIDISNTSRTFSSADSSECSVTHPGLSALNDCCFVVFNHNFSGTSALEIMADECGIVIGTSSTAVAVGDDNLVTPIAHGASAGQMTHYGCYGLNYTTGASSASFDVERIFRNDSGGSITVAEIGIYAATTMDSTYAASQSFCLLRDVISPTVAVGDGEYLKVKYTITVSV